MAENRWTKDQTIVVLATYFSIPFNKANNSNSEIQETARIIGRSVNSVKMKVGNFGSLDPELAKRGIVGLSGATNLDREVWTEYSQNREKLAFESTKLIAQFTQTPLENILNILDEDIPEGKEKLRVIKYRVNQRFFRKSILGIYDFKCCITGIPIQELLVASHIIPWAKDKENRLNPENGICLNTLHDKAFDNGLISINQNYEVIISNYVKDHYPIDSVERYFKVYENNPIVLPERYYPNKTFLENHYQNIFKK